MRIRIIAVLLVALTISGCSSTRAIMLENGASYPPTKHVQILTKAPTRTFKQIAMLEAKGPVNTPITDLLESLKQKAAAIGADAVIPTENTSTQTQPGFVYYPWVGGYQTIGGGIIPVVRGFAIKYTD